MTSGAETQRNSYDGSRANTHPKRTGVGVPLKRRAVKRTVKSFIQGSFLGICLPLANYMVSFSTPDLPRTLHNMHVQFFFKIYSSPEAYRVASACTFWSDKLLLLTQRSLCTLQCIPRPKDGKYTDLLIFYTNRV